MYNRRAMFKKASEAQFEKTFADLAFAKLRDRSPRILDHVIGFQVLDKNDEDTEGAGVFAFDIGGNTYYAPMFFKNGQLKGDQLLYIQSADMFVPLQEKWVNYVLNSKRPQMGESKDASKVNSGADLSSYVTAPGQSKSSSAKASAYFGDILSTPLGESNELDLHKTLTWLPKSAKLKFAKALRSDENFAEAVMKFYDVDALLKTSSYEAPTYNLDLTVKNLQVITGVNKAAADLSKSENKTMMADGVVIRDNRDKTNPVFDGASLDKGTKMLTSRFSNPEPGICARVLMADGTLQKSLIVINFIKGKEYLNEVEDRQIFVVIPLEGSNGVIETTMKNIFVPSDDLITGREDYLKWCEDNKGKSTGSGECAYILDQHGKCVVTKSNRWKANMPINSVIELSGHHDAYAQKYRNFGNSRDGTNMRWLKGSFEPPIINHIVVTNGNGIHLSSDKAFVPASCAAISKTTDNYDTPVIPLGSVNELAASAITSAEYEKIKITSDGIEFTISDNEGQQKPVSKSAAIIRLATHYGINGQLAAKMVNSSIKDYGVGQSKYIIKSSAFSDVDRTSYDNELGVVSRKPELSTETISELQAGPENNEDLLGMTDKARKAAIDAANTGNKEVLDTAILSGLVNSSGATSAVDSYMKTLMAGLDRVGRIMFLFYWHDDKFRERYGAQDIKSLEDSLTTVFDSMGDLILFLKEKTADVDSLLTSGNLELDGSV